MGHREDGDDVGPACLQDAYGFAGGGPGGHHVVEHHHGTRHRRPQPNAAGDVALPVGAGEPDGVAGERFEVQHRCDGQAWVASRRCPGDAGDGIAAATPGGRYSERARA